MSFPPNRPPQSQDDQPRPNEPLTTPAPLPVPHVSVTPDDPATNGWAASPWITIEEEQPPRGETLRRFRRVAWELTQTLVLAALIFLAVRAVAQNFKVEGSSMEPGLHDGQYLLVNKAIYYRLDFSKLHKYLPFISEGDDPLRFIFRGPSRGDVIVFHYPRDPKRDFIKRVIAVPGDTIEIIDGTVFVNDVRLDEPYITNPAQYDYEKRVVPADSYFVLGDNRNNSFDSHSWDFVPIDFVIGQAVFTYWPFENFGGVGNRTINLGIVSVPVPF